MQDSNKKSPRRVPYEALNFTPRFAHGDQAQVVEVTGTADGTLLGSGFARFTSACIPWTVQYDEVLLVLEGEVAIHSAHGIITAGPRDCLWLPRGTELRYESDSALVFFAIHPSNWAETT